MPVELVPRVVPVPDPPATDGQHDGVWHKTAAGALPGGSLITDHVHDYRAYSWERCVVCGLGEAAHAQVAVPF